MGKKIIGMLILALSGSSIALYFFYLWATSTALNLSIHAYIALWLGLFFTFVLTSGLSMLAFASARKNHDEAVHFSTVDTSKEQGTNKNE